MIVARRLGLWGAVFAVLPLLLLAVPNASAQTSLAEQGRAQFQQTCAFCHAPDATGGRGPDLIRSPLVHDDATGAAIAAVIRNGRPERGMPAFALSDRQIAAIVAFLRERIAESLHSSSGPGSGYAAALLLTGDAAAGRAFFEGAGGCTGCHSATGDLAGITGRLTPVQLQQQMLYPEHHPPASATVRLPSGATVSGELARQSEFDLALRDSAGWYHSFRRDQVQATVHDPLAAHQELLAKLAPKTMHDLYAYLATLAKPAPTAARPKMLDSMAPSDEPAEEISSQDLLTPPPGSWPTYNGDYSGRRFSSLHQINAANVAHLRLAWRLDAGKVAIKSTPLEIGGILYFTEPDNVWAADARTGWLIWHYHWPSAGGDHIGQRGVAMLGRRLFFTTPDAHLLCLDARDGKLLWNVVLADWRQGYFSTMAPLVVKNHVLVGVSGDVTDIPGFLESFDPETGALQWRWNTEPAAADPAAKTWPNDDARLHGGGMTWMTGTYDPGLNLVFWGTGNPNPVLEGKDRAGANLYTCSIVALDPDSGKLQWYFQTSPHDVHDWDAVETPVLFDHGRHKFLAQASRNGFFFVLDRTNGKPLVTAPFIDQTWAAGVDAGGHAIPRPDRVATPDGTLVEPASDGATNWMAPSFDPQTGLFYVVARRIFSVFYLTEQGKAEGWAGRDFNVWSNSTLRALDFHSGRVVWNHELGEGESIAGILTTAGGLLFTADTQGDLLALDPVSGRTLWHATLNAWTANSPMTYMADGRQYLLVAAGNSLYAFTD
ncbi:MAG TPA: acido-empty-quinoprotein group A [Terriglobales bacterium]|nr:acido-empty-quinoprotein group A [Terriglobales bacterium]